MRRPVITALFSTIEAMSASRFWPPGFHSVHHPLIDGGV
jgi:hypothetical protein